ncbi:polyketide synthase [Legionella sainthelensi]|uniref:Polyketide synthase n=1 Tax=Legionella sainthelensi TaxID=28087 RepID=A0A0W0YJV1_9GAMM|nr:type I polyketide synthase [Legionella sainthelensi]KTD57099.1 polyketide synthase [Legionella sainthelensi]VEH37622.1 polyketide synthase [Legionella sainthelensi]
MNKKKRSYKYSVIELFESQVKTTSDYIALSDKKSQYTYYDLNQKVNQFSHCLRKNGIIKGDCVAILLDPSTDFILCILAIAKLGAVYVPMDTLAPVTRLNHMLNDTNPRLVITSDELKQKLQEISVPQYLVRQLHLESISYSKENIKEMIHPEEPLYMIYTSGSTGKPKGVIIPHQSVVNLAVVENYASVQSGQIVAQCNNLAFDASTFEIWSSLLNGGKLCVISKEVRTNPLELKKTLEDNAVEYLLLPTALFHQLIKSAPKALNQPKTILFGGEQINPALLRQFIVHRNKINKPVTLINGYGPSEATTFACRHVINEKLLASDEHLSAIGVPFKNTQTYVLDEQMNEADEGELYLSGIHLALGYHRSEEITFEKFIKNPFCQTAPFERMYKTGDLVKKLPTGELLYTGRVDDQVKVGGYRIHLSEVERKLMKHNEVSLAAVVVEMGGGLHKMLTAYIVFSSPHTKIHADELREFLSQELPSYMLPAKYVMVDELPLTPIGKIDKTKLDQIPHTDLSFYIDKSLTNKTEETLKEIWNHLLNRSHIEVNKNLFDLGATSLLITEACTLINQALHTELQVVDLLEHPTIHKLTKYIEGDIDVPMVREIHSTASWDIAIVGMSCRFPGANNIDQFWDNLCQGKDCLTRFNSEEFSSSLQKTSNFVPVKGVLTDIDQFDASFFNFSPVDANITDPQQRIFLECAWEALEHAAVAPKKQEERTISVFAGMTDSTYLHENLLKNNRFCREYDLFHQRIATSLSMLSTQTSYRLNLKGRSVNVNTACSTGLIAVDHACQDLILGHSDIALAGASCITIPQIDGYIYQPGSIVSPDGYCRPFSSKANGTVFSNGVGVVVLKRLEDAINDRNTIYAVIKSRGVNNDGVDKLGFTAPSMSGQVSCIKDALCQAKITPEQISFVETHGTATALGDVIEIHALSAVYREQTDRSHYCALGSVKANIGHTDVAAGIAGLIKTALCLYYKKITPLIYFDKPNPHLGLEGSPFYVNDQLMDWENDHGVRYAGISSFGVGGTNVHMILSDYDVHQQSTPRLLQTEELVMISGKTQRALEEQIQKLDQYLSTDECHDYMLRNIAYTLHKGRDDFNWRHFSVGKKIIEIQKGFQENYSVYCDDELQYSVVLMFSGQGTQYPRMAMELFDLIPRFREYVLQGINAANHYLNCDLLYLIKNSATDSLAPTQFTQPALFIIEYALARLLMDCGVQPDVLIGHSIGEYVAACLAGVFSFEDGIALVCERGLLMANVPAGQMLSIECSDEECQEYQLIAGVSLALHNATHQYVLAGSPERIEILERHLMKHKKQYHKLKVSHAFHSDMMECLEKPFKELFSNITLSPPTIPIVSNVTGDWLSAEDAMSPDYWYRHLRHTVQFARGVHLLLQDEHPLFVEVGLGQSLCGFVTTMSSQPIFVTPTLPGRYKAVSDMTQFLTTLGRLWTKGVSVLLDPVYGSSIRKKIALPTYAFQRQRYWIHPDEGSLKHNKGTTLYSPVWTREALSEVSHACKVSDYQWVVFKDTMDIGQQIINVLSFYNAQPVIIEAGDEFIIHSQTHFTINPAVKEHYIDCFNCLKKALNHPKFIHCWSLDAIEEPQNDTTIESGFDKGFYSLLYVIQSYVELIGAQHELSCCIMTHGTQPVLGTERLSPANATLSSFCRVVPLEHPLIRCLMVDIARDVKGVDLTLIFADILATLIDKSENILIAYRNNYRWLPSHVAIENNFLKSRLSDKGIYLITGGLGGIGLALSEAIATQVSQPILILSSRRSYPPQDQWTQILKDKNHEEHGTISQLKYIESLGASINLYPCDVTNEQEVSQLLHWIFLNFGKLNGLIHAAGRAGKGVIQLKTHEKAHQVLSTKIYGAYYLAKATHNLPILDFVVLISSIAAVVGAKGQLDYSAANAGLDVMAQSNLFHSKFTLSLNWNTWRDVGMSVDSSTTNALNLFNLGNDISSQEGQSLFLNALSTSYRQLIISNYELARYQALLANPVNQQEETKNTVAREYLNIKTIYSEPEDELEKQLAELWQECLHIDFIGREDNFFALGGHSLKAMSLVEQMNAVFNCSLSIQHMYKAPTIALLRQLISENQKQTIDIIVPLNEVDELKPKLFFCHPVSGLVYCFNEIASLWKSASIYGIQDPSISVGKMLYDSIDSMAKQYVDAILHIQPQGPYNLVGYSFGGTMVYEIAHRLRQQHHEIGLLVLIESWSVFSPRQREDSYSIEHFFAMDDKKSKELAYLAAERMRLLLEHEPTRTNQDMILFKAKKLNDGYLEIDDPYNGWAKFNKGNIICRIIDANHDTIMNEENSKMIAEFLQKSDFYQ